MYIHNSFVGCFDCCMKVCVFELLLFFAYLSGEGGGVGADGTIFFLLFSYIFC